MNERLFPLSHNTSIFIIQSIISLSSVGVISYLLIDGRQPSVFLPVLTGIIGYWLPSPTTNIHKNINGDQPSNLIQSPQTTITEGTNTYINPPNNLSSLPSNQDIV